MDCYKYRREKIVATLNQLVDVRSSLARGLRGYLRALVEWIDQESPPHLKGRRISEVYVTPEVLKEDSQKRVYNDQTRLRADSLAEERLGRFTSEKDRQKRVPWDREVRHIRRAAIIGMPGSGKTLLCRMTTRNVAQENLKQLEARRKSFAELNIPIWLRLSDVVDQGLEEGVSARELIYAGKLLKSGLSNRDSLYSTLVAPLTHDLDLKRSIQEIVSNYFVL